MAITGEGIVLGPGTILARMEADARNRPRLVFDPRGAAAILCTVLEQPVGPHFLGKMRRAVELWNEGEHALAQFHLIFAGLPPCDGEGAQLRAFVAEKMLDAGVSPNVLLKAQGVDPASLAAFDAPLAKAHYNPDQPRDERGRWDGGGIEEAAWRRGKNRLKPLIDFLESLGSRARRWVREHEAKPDPTPKTQPENERLGTRLEYAKPDYLLPRPGKGEPVDIPGLPGVKGTDVSESSARMPNYVLGLTRSEFEAKLRDLGWRAELSSDGKAMNYFSPGGTKYSIRDDAKTFDGPTADYHFDARSRKLPDMKLRLRAE
jgi:hypothetical protein